MEDSVHEGTDQHKLSEHELGVYTGSNSVC